jgi:hypothetical protein
MAPIIMQQSNGEKANELKWGMEEGNIWMFDKPVQRRMPAIANIMRFPRDLKNFEATEINIPTRVPRAKERTISMMGRTRME